LLFFYTKKCSVQITRNYIKYLYIYIYVCVNNKHGFKLKIELKLFIFVFKKMFDICYELYNAENSMLT